mgnify:CR=1 FL=1
MFFNYILGKFNGKHYFLKPLELAREERMDMTKIPSDKDQFESYVNQHLMKKDLSVPYLLNEFIKGEEYAANVVCKNGQIYMFQVSNYSKVPIISTGLINVSTHIF